MGQEHLHEQQSNEVYFGWNVKSIVSLKICVQYTTPKGYNEWQAILMIGPLWRYLNGPSLYCQIFHISEWGWGNYHSILDIIEAKIGGGGGVPPRCYHLLLYFWFMPTYAHILISKFSRNIFRISYEQSAPK